MQTDQVHVFVKDIQDVGVSPCEGELTHEDGERLARLTSPVRRAQFHVGRRLLSEALQFLCGKSALSWRITSENGRAVVVGDGVPRISLSHSSKRVVCAVSRFPVGVDIEFERDRDFSSLAQFVCTDNEWREFQCLGDSERRSRFYQLWSLKEATYKALNGEVELARLEFRFGDKPVLVSGQPDGTHPWLNIFTLGEGYHGALAVIGPGVFHVVHHTI